MQNNKVSINAILDEDVEKFLRSTSFYEDFISGKLNCLSCGQKMTPKNLSIIIPQIKDEKVVSLKFYCEDIECTEKYHNKQ